VFLAALFHGCWSPSMRRLQHLLTMHAVKQGRGQNGGSQKEHVLLPERRSSS
jgi:hypothetical protein